MENKIQTQKEVNDALVDVRKAHRLIYQYQKRVIDIIYYIRERYTMPQFAGVRRFCSTINYKQGLKDEYDVKMLRLERDMWGWDFLYSYLFEFYLGAKKFSNKEISLSIIEASDSGFYQSKQTNKHQTNISSFTDVDESETCLIFVFESITSKKKKYVWDLDNAINKILEGQNELIISTKEDNYFIAKKYNLVDFVDQFSTDKVIHEFSKLVESKTSIKLLDK